MVEVKRPLYWFHNCPVHGEVNAVMVKGGWWVCPECKGPVKMWYTPCEIPGIIGVAAYTPSDVYPDLWQS